MFDLSDRDRLSDRLLALRETVSELQNLLRRIPDENRCHFFSVAALRSA